MLTLGLPLLVRQEMAVLSDKSAQASAEHEMSVGDPISFAVRRDKIRIVFEASQDMNTLTGEVINVEYQGTDVKVGLNTAQDDELIAYMDDRECFEKPLKAGDAVISEWPSDDVCHLLGSNHSSGV